MKGTFLCYAGLIATTLAAVFFPLPPWAHMLTVVMLTLYIGCQMSLRNQEDGDTELEHMSSRDVYFFPIIGSVVLFSLYLVFKFLPEEMVMVVVKIYFFVFGVLVLTGVFADIASPLVGGPGKVLFKFRTQEFTLLDLPCFVLSLLMGVWYLWDNHWAANNIFGLAFSIQGIGFLSLGSFFNGVILLAGLFVYDIFWVFGTEVMVTVAKKFDAPIKLLFPRDLTGEEPPSLLGLGDIVIPGIFIALLLRFDAHRHKQRKEAEEEEEVPLVGKGKEDVKEEAPLENTPYFWVTYVCYFLGLSTTVLVMYWFQHAQPALLYLVPACLGSAAGVALWRGELRELWQFTEEAEEDTKKTQ